MVGQLSLTIEGHCWFSISSWIVCEEIKFPWSLAKVVFTVNSPVLDSRLWTKTNQSPSRLEIKSPSRNTICSDVKPELILFLKYFPLELTNSTSASTVRPVNSRSADDAPEGILQTKLVNSSPATLANLLPSDWVKRSTEEITGGSWSPQLPSHLALIS